jgi:uncharacterized protein
LLLAAPVRQRWVGFNEWMTNPYIAPVPPLSPADEKLWAILTHVGGMFFGIWVPLVTYLVFKDRGPFIRQHTATALNFHLTILIAVVAGTVLAFILIGFLILFAIPIVTLIFSIMAAIAANNGQHYVYPVTFRFVN